MQRRRTPYIQGDWNTVGEGWMNGVFRFGVDTENTTWPREKAECTTKDSKFYTARIASTIGSSQWVMGWRVRVTDRTPVKCRHGSHDWVYFCEKTAEEKDVLEVFELLHFSSPRYTYKMCRGCKSLYIWRETDNAWV